MTTSTHGWSGYTKTWLTFLGGLMAFGLGLEVPAQEKGKQPPEKGKPAAAEADAPRGKWKLHSVVRVGYTRPGSPEDKLDEKGKIRPLAWQPDYDGKMIGGTVFFMVLERTGTDGDTWGTGFENFNSKFVEGKNYKNNFSPALDTQAKYLYLYQVINDRGLDPTPIVPVAMTKGLRSEPIAGTALKLLVDPRYITSWGHFKGMGFNALVPDRKRSGDVVAAADGSTTKIRLAVSSSPAILGELPYKRYLDGSPAYPLNDLRDALGLGSSTSMLKDSTAFKELTKKKADGVAVAFEQNMLQAFVNAKEPEFVQLLYSGYGENELPVVNEKQEVQAIFRADWKGDGIMNLGFHSTVFGFTTDLAPTDTNILIEGPEKLVKGAGGMARAQGLDGFFLVAQVDDPIQLAQGGQGIVPAAATGVAPTPLPAPPLGAGGTAGVLGGGPAGFGGGGGGGGIGGGAGGIGGAGIPFVGGGGGFGGGSGGGTGNGNGQQNQTPLINFQNTMNIQQNQSQSQSQDQSQSQSQSGGGTGVVPEPGAIILALLGLPGLFFLRRFLARPRSSPQAV